MAEPADILYAVVVNHRKQYSIWAADRPAPRGWDEAGFRGGREECLAYVEEVWSDMRPADSARP
jgi:MbtH protein